MSFGSVHSRVQEWVTDPKDPDVTGTGSATKGWRGFARGQGCLDVFPVR